MTARSRLPLPEVPVKTLSGRTLAAFLALAAASLPAVAQQPGARSLRQLNMDAMANLGPDGILRVQQLLKDRGFDPVRLDGVLGPLTRAALTGFQEKYGIKTRGEIDNQTLFALGAVDLAAGEPGQGR